jgi:serine/threonine protein kinase
MCKTCPTMGSKTKSSASNKYLGGADDGDGDSPNTSSNNNMKNNFGNGTMAPSGGRSRRRGEKDGAGSKSSTVIDFGNNEDVQQQQQQLLLPSSFQFPHSQPQVSSEMPNLEVPLLPRKRSQATKSPVPPDFNSAGVDDIGDEDEQESGGNEESLAIDGDYNTTSTISVIGGDNIQVDCTDEHDDIDTHACEQHNDSNASATATTITSAALGSSFSKQQLHYHEDRASPYLPTGRRSTENNPKKQMTPKRRRKQSSTETRQHQLQLQPKTSFKGCPPRNTGRIDSESSSNNKMNDDISSVLFSPKPTSRHRRKSQNYPPTTTSSRRPRPPAPAPPSPMITSTTPISRDVEAPSSPSSAHVQSQSSLLSPSSDATTTTTTPFRFHSFPASLPRVNPPSSGISLREVKDDEFGRSSVIHNECGDNEEHDKNPFLLTTAEPTTVRKQPLTLHPRRNRRDVMLMTSSSTSDDTSTNAIASQTRLLPPSPASRRLFVPRSSSMDETSTDNNSNSKGHATYPSSNRVAYTASSPSSASSSSSSSSSCQSPEKNNRVRMLRNGPAPATVAKKPEAKHKSNTLDEDDELDEDNDSGSSILSCEEDVSGKRLNFNSPQPLLNCEDGDDQEDLDVLHPPPPPPRQTLETVMHPHTPRGLLLTTASAGVEGQLHMMPNLEVSPITRFPEDYDDDSHEMVIDSATADEENDGIDDSVSAAPESFLPPTVRTTTAERTSSKNVSHHHHHHLLQGEKVEDGSRILDTSALSTTDIGNNDVSYASEASLPSRQSMNTIESAATTVNKSNLSHSNVLNTTTTTHRPTARKSRRPMPDTSAFDVSGGGSIHTPSQQSLGSKDSGFHSRKTGGTSVGSISSGGGGSHPQAARLFCPPTPIRTPAWAHHVAFDRGGGQGGHQHVLKRSNSLISTKVLAMMPCPPRILDNLSSLEDSMLENDVSGSTLDTTTVDGEEGRGGEEGELHSNRKACLTLAVEETDEHDECMFRSLESGSGDVGFSTARPLDQSQDETSSIVPIGGSSSKNYATHDGGSTSRPSSHSSIEGEDINFSDFENLGTLGSGAFADVYKVRSKKRDRRLYAIKRTRRQFRGVKDRDRAMAEVNTMKLLQSALFSEAAAASSITSHQQENRDVSGNTQHHSKNNYGLYLLFFIRAWQQDGFFYCQTELCSRATCRHLRLSLSSDWARDVGRYPSLKLCLLEKGTDTAVPSSFGVENKERQINDDRLIPERAVWQICHDISRGLFHIHFHGMVHYDIKPSNIFFAYNSKWGAICKIGDFGLAGDIGTRDDGQEGDTAYMPSEVLLSSCEKHPSADIFCLGLALYELAASPSWLLPREGDRWHEIRSGTHRPDLPRSRSESLLKLIQAMTHPSFKERPSAESILELKEVKLANATSDSFLSRYITDVERYDLRREKEIELAEEEARRRYVNPVI